MQRTPRPQRGTPSGGLFLLALSFGSALALAGCGILPLPVRSSVLVPLEEPAAQPVSSRPIEGTVDLCLDPALRTKVWRRAPEAFAVKLGPSASVGVERLAKRLIRRVRVDFSRTCVGQGSGPWLTARIALVERERVERGMRTHIALDFDLRGPNEKVLWSDSVSGEVVTEPDLYTRLFVRDATRVSRDVASALRDALDESQQQLSKSSRLRDAIEGRS